MASDCSQAAQDVIDMQKSIVSKGGLAWVTEQSLMKERDC